MKNTNQKLKSECITESSISDLDSSSFLRAAELLLGSNLMLLRLFNSNNWGINADQSFVQVIEFLILNINRSKGSCLRKMNNENR